jgi:hypothetical protein
MLKIVFFLTFMAFVSAQRSSYLDRFTTQSPYDSPYDRDRHREPAAGSYDRYGSATSRRPSYATDKWGDAVGGSGHHHEHAGYGSETPAGSYGGSWGRQTTSRYGSGSGSGSSWGSGSGSAAGSRFDKNDAYVRIQVEFVRFTNDKGIAWDGSKCDTFTDCDPVVTAYIDTERPFAEFPGSVDSQHWPQILRLEKRNTFDFAKHNNLTRDVCGAPYKRATLRVLVEDHDGASKNDLMNKFDCDLSAEPDTNGFASTWQTENCTPKATNAEAKKMRLTIRYKVFQVQRFQCDPNTGKINVAGGTTAKPTTPRHG